MKVAVVGSGPAGVAVSRALLDADGDVQVEMLDFGNQIEPESDALAEAFRGGLAGPAEHDRLKPARADAGIRENVSHWLKALTGRAPLLDLTEKARLGSLFTFRDVDWGIPASADAAPLSRSLARGGLSNVWGAACYPMVSSDFATWPITEAELVPHYHAAARMLSLSETDDALASVYPIHGTPSAGFSLNAPARELYLHWQTHGDAIRALGVHAGRARLAVREHDDARGVGCQECGLCLSGCPYDAIYRADWTLAELERSPRFTYVPGLLVRRFTEGVDGVSVEALEGQGGPVWTHSYDALFLASGTLSSLRIAAESLGHHDYPVPLVDNDLFLVPLLRTRGETIPTSRLHFTLNELALRVVVDGCPVHLQIYCMSGQVVDRFRPLLDVLPGAARSAVDRALGRLLLGFVYLPGERSTRIRACVEERSPLGHVTLTQQRSRDSRRIAGRFLRFLGRHTRLLGLLPIGPPLRSTPAGHSGGHLAGALPMTRDPGVLQTDRDGRLHGTRRVHVVDGAALTSLPAQNSTYTIMANAHRIGSRFARSA